MYSWFISNTITIPNELSQSFSYPDQVDVAVMIGEGVELAIYVGVASSLRIRSSESAEKMYKDFRTHCRAGASA